jgi:hypothetical protein
VDRHHVGEVVGRDTKTPAVPIEETYVGPAVARQETVPDMRVAVNDRHCTPAQGALDEARRPIEQQRIKVPSLSRRAIAEPVLELSDLVRDLSQIVIDRLPVAPIADRGAETRIVPSVRMERRPGAKDGLALG